MCPRQLKQKIRKDSPRDAAGTKLGLVEVWILITITCCGILEIIQQHSVLPWKFGGKLRQWIKSNNQLNGSLLKWSRFRSQIKHEKMKVNIWKFVIRDNHHRVAAGIEKLHKHIYMNLTEI
jgi:hypothetical protein